MQRGATTSETVAALEERLARGKGLVVLGRCVLEEKLVAGLDGTQRDKGKLVAARRRRAIADGGGGHGGGDDRDVADAGVIEVAREREKAGKIDRVARIGFDVVERGRPVLAARVKRRLRDSELERSGGDAKRVEPDNGGDASKRVAMAVGDGGAAQRVVEQRIDARTALADSVLQERRVRVVGDQVVVETHVVDARTEHKWRRVGGRGVSARLREPNLLKEPQRQQTALSVSVGLVEMQARQFGQGVALKGLHGTMRQLVRRGTVRADDVVAPLTLGCKFESRHVQLVRSQGDELRLLARRQHGVVAQLGGQSDAVLRCHAMCAKRLVPIHALRFGQRGECPLHKEHVARIE